MPGKGAKERRKLREQQRILDIKEAEKTYIENGGVKNCRSCYCYSRCPVYGDEIMSCWCYGGNNHK